MSLNPGALNPQVGGAGGGFSGVSPVVWNTLTDGDATPDVSGGTFFETANTGATSITDFDGATNAFIVLRAGDANTTIVHDATKIVLQGGLSIPLAANDQMMFVERSGVWYELTIR
jgi:hypothetical protein